MASIAPGPAVDAVNEKVDGFGGVIANKSIYGVDGSITFPLTGQFGAQIDGTAGSLDSNTFAGIAGHWFWRDPSRALVGIYASETYWDRYGGINAGHLAAEGEYFWGPVTLQGITGLEFGNSASNVSSSIGPVVATTVIDAYNVKTRFFDEVNLKYYFDNNISTFIGHRYLGGKNALAFGGEIAGSLGNGMLASAFVEGRFGEDDFRGVWGGLKVYFGPTDKPLIARHRQEDPPSWNVDNLFAILNNHSTTTSQSCVHGLNGSGNCETPIPSDRRLKRDFVLLARLANGLGIYRYRYLWSDTLYVGVIAQEVMAVNPLAVVLAADGFLRVNYARLGLRMLTWNEWRSGRNIQNEVLGRLAA